MRTKPAAAGRTTTIARWSAAVAVLCLAQLVGSGPASACEGALSGREVAIDATLQPGFGTVQKLPRLPLEPGEYAITIDDGPTPRTTPALLDVLKARCVKATFFLVGRNIEKHPELVRRILAEGHAVGSHSFTHADFAKLSDNQVRTEIAKGAAALEVAAYGKFRDPLPPRLFRFPGSGSFTVPGRAALDFTRGMGLVVAGYDISPEDWRNSPARESYARLLKRLGDRGVIVLHDNQPNTIELLPMVFDEFEKRGAKTVVLRTAPRT